MGLGWKSTFYFAMTKLEPKRKYNLSMIATELGFPFNNCGNFTLLPTSSGYWFCCMRLFAYYIDNIGRYLSNERLWLKQPHLHKFCILDKDFNFVKKLNTVESGYWQHPNFKNELPYLEDARLAMWEGTPYISSTVCYLKDRKWNALGV